MSGKSDKFYFDNFAQSMSIACEASRMIKETLINFNPATLPAKLNKLHQIEHRGDDKNHELVSQIARAFITPIERDDIMELSRNIDNVTDSIEDILIRIYILNVTEIRDDAMNFANLLINCCSAAYELMEEFRNFKKSNKLSEMVIKINKIEEQGDEMYINSMRNLHTTQNDPLVVAAWSEIYGYFEKCFDACEDVADTVESVVIANT